MKTLSFGRASKITLIVATIMAMILFATQPCIADVNNKKLIVGVEDIENYPNYVYDYRTKKFSGFMRDVLDAFGQQYGYEMIYRPLPVKRLYYELTYGKIDFKFPDRPDWGSSYKSQYDVHYSNAIIWFTEGIMTLAERPFSSLNEVKSIAYVRGFSPPALVQAASLYKIKIVETADVKDAISMVLSHKVDGAFLDIAGGQWLLNTYFHQPGALVFQPSLPNVHAPYFISTVDNVKALNEFNQFLAKNAELLNKIKQKFGLTMTGQKDAKNQ
jgi:polar amino acid transport system substrate-binding protein